MNAELICAFFRRKKKKGRGGVAFLSMLHSQAGKEGDMKRLGESSNLVTGKERERKGKVVDHSYSFLGYAGGKKGSEKWQPLPLYPGLCEKRKRGERGKPHPFSSTRVKGRKSRK